MAVATEQNAAADAEPSGDSASAKPSFRRRWIGFRRWRLFLLILAGLLALRALLPIAAGAYANSVLGDLGEFTGSLGDVDINFWKGAYSIQDLRLEKRSGDQEPFLQLAQLDLQVEWGGLLRGELVAEAVCHRPVLSFVQGETEAESQTGSEESWTEKLDALLPFRVNRFVVRDGEVRFLDSTGDVPVDVYMNDLYLEALNISNVRSEKSDALPAEVEIAGRPFGTGEFEVRFRFDPLTDPLRFELDAELRKVAMTDLNDFLHVYGDLDAEGGTLNVSVELAAAQGKIEGYVKSLFRDLALLRFGEIDGPGDALEALWEGFVAIAAEVLENQPRDQLAARVPVSGQLETGVEIDIIALVGNLLRNAFIVALRPAIDNSIELSDLSIGPQSGGGR